MSNIAEIRDSHGKYITMYKDVWWVCPKMGTFNVAGRPQFFMAGDRVMCDGERWLMEFDVANRYRFKLEEESATVAARESEPVAV
jgi:hypothetical protein